MKLTSNLESEVPRIALTCGEPAGIGPELCLAVARETFACDLVCVGDIELLKERALRIGSTVRLQHYDPQVRTQHTPGSLAVCHQSLAAPSLAGTLDVRNAPYVLQILDRAVDGALAREFDNTDELKRRHAVEEIRASKADEETELWLRRLRDEAYVELRV